MFSPGLLALCLGSGSPGTSAKGSASVPARGATRSAEPTGAAHTAQSRGGQPGGRQTGGKSRIQSSLFNCPWLVENENWLWRARSYLRVQSELGSGFLPLWVPKLWLLPELILAGVRGHSSLVCRAACAALEGYPAGAARGAGSAASAAGVCSCWLTAAQHSPGAPESALQVLRSYGQ